MIPVEETRNIATKAQEVMGVLFQHYTRPPDYFVASPLSPLLGIKRVAAARTAEFLINLETGEHPVISEYKLPDERYLSWLIISPVRNIAFNSNQAKGSFASKEVQISRAIFHELGHIYVTPELLTGVKGEVIDGKEFTRPATPKQEEKAWIWAMFFIGLQMGHYANSCRNPDSDSHKGYDDTATLCTEGQLEKDTQQKINELKKHIKKAGKNPSASFNM